MCAVKQVCHGDTKQAWAFNREKNKVRKEVGEWDPVRALHMDMHSAVVLNISRTVRNLLVRLWSVLGLNSLLYNNDTVINRLIVA